MIEQWAWAMVIWVAALGGEHKPVEIPHFQTQEACTRELARIKNFSNDLFTGVCICKAENQCK